MRLGGGTRGGTGPSLVTMTLSLQSWRHCHLQWADGPSVQRPGPPGIFQLSPSLFLPSASFRLVCPHHKGQPRLPGSYRDRVGPQRDWLPFPSHLPLGLQA